MKIKAIQTPRLILRGFTSEDARFAMGIWNDPEMGEYLPDPSSAGFDDEYTKAYLKELAALGDDKVCCYLISEQRETGKRIGTCSFIPEEDGSVYDIAYCVHKDYWRQGYATEMAQGMIDYARAHGAQKITIRINRENEASNMIAAKLGFHIAGEKTYKKRGTELVFTDNLYELTL